MSTATPAPSNLLIRRIVIDLAVMTVIGVFLGLIGPFGTMAMPLSWRMLSWLAFAYVGYAIYSPMGLLVGWGQTALALPRVGLWVAVVVIATIPMTIAVQLIMSLPGPLRWPGLEVIVGTYSSVLVIGGGVTLLFQMIKPGFREAAPRPAMPASPPEPPSAPPSAPAPASAAPPPPNPLFDQLPPELGSDIIALEMEDHYVRVHTALGSALVLMRLRDAMALVGEIEGMQVHRSWWVARAAVEDAVRDGRNIRLTLARGIEAPVARAKIADLRDARWI
jgi:hypothetical protein